MATFGIKASTSTTFTLISISRALALATVLAASVGTAQAADSSDRITPPSPAEVALLRGLLSLQHPALRGGAAPVQAAPTASPAVTTEPSSQGNSAPAATEGEACVPSTGIGATACGFSAETRVSRNTPLGAAFRESLERAVAVAGLSAERL